MDLIGEEKNIWDVNVEPEKNSYNWEGLPKVEKAKKVNSETKLIHVDLFSGCGGFSTGFEQAGFTTNLAIDIHPPSLETLRLNHKYANTILGDIRKIDSKKIEKYIPSNNVPMVMTAGVPCQGFSLSNRKRHANDKRNFLFKEFIRIAKDIKPTAVVLENVSGLVSTKDGYFKKSICRAIEEIGYEVYFALLNAAEYGVPQKRRRVFFIGLPKGMQWFFPERTHQDKGLNRFITVEEAILEDLPSLKSGEESMEYKSDSSKSYAKFIRQNNKTLLNHRAPNHPPETIERIENTIPGEPMYKDFKQRIRLHPDLPSPTQICGGIRPQFQFGHPTQSRGLTIRERARIQSFPDSYLFTGGICQGRYQTGNSVPPILAKVIAKQLADVLLGKKIYGEPPESIQGELF